MPEADGPTWADFATGWELGIYKDPILCGVLAGLVLGYVGVFVVLRRMVFVTAAVSQSSGLGVALAFFSGIHLGVEVHPVIGAGVVALSAAALLGLPAERLRIPREGILGLVYIGASGLAVLVGDRIKQEAHEIDAILFGPAVLVRDLDLVLVAAVGAAVMVVMLLFHRGLVFAAFDPEGARVQGVPVRLLDVVLWVVISLEVAVATRALGAMPVFAFAVLPALGALMVAGRMGMALVLSAVLGAAAGGLGYLFAFFLEFPVGGSQATVALLLLLMCLPVGLARGRLQRHLQPRP